jgi:hypothetical protein
MATMKIGTKRCTTKLQNQTQRHLMFNDYLKKRRERMRKGDFFPQEHLTRKNYDMSWYLLRLFEKHGNNENRNKGCTTKLQNQTQRHLMFNEIKTLLCQVANSCKRRK